MTISNEAIVDNIFEDIPKMLNLLSTDIYTMQYKVFALFSTAINFQ